MPRFNPKRFIENQREDLIHVASKLQNNPARYEKAFTDDEHARAEFRQLVNDLTTLFEAIDAEESN